MRAHQVLATLATGDRQQGNLCAEATAEIGEQGGVFIVGMRGDVKDASDVLEAVQPLKRRRQISIAWGEFPTSPRSGMTSSDKRTEQEERQEAEKPFLDAPIPSENTG